MAVGLHYIKDFKSGNIICTISATSRTFSVSASLALLNNNRSNMTIRGIFNGDFRNTIVQRVCSAIFANFCKCNNICTLNIRINSAIAGILAVLNGNRFASQSSLTISLRNLSLCSHNNLTSGSNNLLTVSFVDIASQSRHQHSGKDGQDDQNDDELYQGEALLVLHFANFLEYDKFLH